MMKKFRSLLSVLMCVCLLAGMAALAEETAQPVSTPEATAQPAAAPEATAEPIPPIAEDAVLATLNGADITWGDAQAAYSSLVNQYGNYYDLTDAANVNLLRSVAMENAITETLLMNKAVELGLSELTEEEISQLDASAAADWESAMSNYMSYAGLTDESTEEEKASLRAQAEAYYLEAGYTAESLKADYRRYAVLDKVQDLMVGDVTVTDEEVEALYQSLVAADKELYENDVAAYVEYNNYVDMMAYYAQMYGSANDMDHAWYKPEGFRAVKHILLPVDEALMTAYTDLQARYEEQQAHADEAAQDAQDNPAAEPAEGAEPAEAAEPEATAEPVTAEQVNEAKAAILSALAGTIDEINQKIAEGVEFDELIATYGVDADGNPSDPGMNAEPYKTSGYEVCSASSNYVPEFVEAAMSIPELGGVSAPYLSSYGIHIVKYIGDVPGGPVEMTEAQREAKRAGLLSTKQNERYAEKVDEWMAGSTLTYTGVVPSYDELTAAE